MSQVVINAYCPKCNNHIDLGGIKLTIPEVWQEDCEKCGRVIFFQIKDLSPQEMALYLKKELLGEDQ